MKIIQGNASAMRMDIWWMAPVKYYHGGLLPQLTSVK